VRPSAARDAIDMAPRLRVEDMAEIAAASGRPPVEALGEGFACSRPCFTVEYNGRPAAMFGVVPSPDTEFPRLGVVWLLGTDAVRVFGRPFLRHSREWLVRACEGYDVVGNFVDERNTAHVRWLKWLGFTFLKRHEHFGRLGLPFMEFVKIMDTKEPPGV
jgi:hypothetical protein